MLTRLREAMASDRWRRRAWLAAIVVVLAVYKITVTRHTFWTNIDGGYYTEVAAHVRDGHGLVSSCSILYEAYPRFPHPTAVYPLWPLLVGLVAKVFPIFEVGKWLATACYFATLGFAYLWGAALYPKPLLPVVAPSFNAGHLIALMFGLHDFFFGFTSWPYTEGLSYAVACAGLWRMTRLLPRPTVRGGLEVGVWLGLAILARYQMVLMAMAAFPVLAGAAVLSSGPRGRYAAMTLAAAVGMVLVVGPHYAYVASFTPHLTPSVYVQWQRVRFADGLSPIPDVLEVKGAAAWIRDRLHGFTFAYDPHDVRVGYALRYYTFQWAVVAAVPLLAWLGLRNASRDAPRAAWRWLRRPANLNWIYVVVFSVGCFVMIHSMHMSPQLYPEWYFAQRHALVCMFVFFISLVLLLAQERSPFKLIGVFILCSSTYMGLQSIGARAREAEKARAPAPGPSAFVRWLNDEAARRGGMIVALRQPQPIAYLTRGVGFHWYYGGTTLQDVRAMVALGAVYLIEPAGQVYPFNRAPDFDRSFHLVQTIDGNRIFAPDPSILPAPVDDGGRAPKPPAVR